MFSSAHFTGVTSSPVASRGWVPWRLRSLGASGFLSAGFKHKASIVRRGSGLPCCRASPQAAGMWGWGGSVEAGLGRVRRQTLGLNRAWGRPALLSTCLVCRGGRLPKDGVPSEGAAGELAGWLADPFVGPEAPSTPSKPGFSFLLPGLGAAAFEGRIVPRGTEKTPSSESEFLSGRSVFLS